MLGNISIFWKYHNISLDNILYHGYSWISKYCISIFIVFIIVKDEVYSLDMYNRINSYETKYQAITFSYQNCEIFTCDSLLISYNLNKITKLSTFWFKDNIYSYREMNLDNIFVYRPALDQRISI